MKKGTQLVDLLEEDKPIAQQKFVCVSFVSPETIIKDKSSFIFQEFVRTWDLSKSMEKYAQFTAFMAFKYGLDEKQINDDLSEFCREESKALNQASTIDDDYKNFVEKNGDVMEQKFNEAHEFQTSTRGLKIRGVFPTQGEAELRAKLLREADPYFDVFVGPVGVWMPWDPDAYKTGKVEFLEKTLNELMHKKKDNEDAAKDHFTQRLRESKMKAIEENRAKAAASGNKVTQTINESGELVAVKNTNSQVSGLEANGFEVSEDTIRETLFENENVVVPPKKN